jgi:hypothetical protein
MMVRALSATGLPLCVTCGRLKSHHTNPVAHAFDQPWIVPPWRRRPLRGRHGAKRTDFGARIEIAANIALARAAARRLGIAPLEVT